MIPDRLMSRLSGYYLIFRLAFDNDGKALTDIIQVRLDKNGGLIWLGRSGDYRYTGAIKEINGKIYFYGNEDQGKEMYYAIFNGIMHPDNLSSGMVMSLSGRNSGPICTSKAMIQFFPNGSPVEMPPHRDLNRERNFPLKELTDEMIDLISNSIEKNNYVLQMGASVSISKVKVWRGWP